MKRKKSIIGIKIVVVILIFFSITVAKAQTTFNKEVKIMNFITGEGPLFIYNDTIIYIGYGTDYYEYSDYAYFMAKFDLKGELVKRDIDTFGGYHFQHINEGFIVDNKIIVACNYYKRNVFNGGYLMQIDIPSGKIEKKIYR